MKQSILGNFLWLLVLMMVSGMTLADSLVASTDRNSMSLDETLNFKLVYEGQQTNKDPDLSVLTQQFDVLSNQKSMQHSIINGSVSASTEWQMVLSPKNTGQLLIPPITLNGQRSEPLTIAVSEASKDPISGTEDVFIETVIDKTQVYVQEQFLVTYRLYYNRSVDSLDAQQLAIDGTRIEILPRADYQKTLGHTQYGVAEFKYAIFPDASGTITIPSQTWTIRTTEQPSMSRFGFSGGRYKLHRAKTEELTIEVAPKPAEYPGHAVWLPAQSVTLEEAWSQPPENLKVGEPITRTVTLKAAGVAAEQIAPIFNDAPSADFKFYPDKPSQDKSLNERGVLGTRTESVAIVANHSGELELPAVEVTWWNTEQKQVEVATLPARKLQVTGSANSPQVAAPTQTSVAPPLTNDTHMTSSKAPWWWIWIGSASILTNIILMVLLWRRSSAQETKTKPDGLLTDANEAALFKDIRSACDAASAESLRLAILAWSKHRWKINNLAKLGELSGDTQLIEELRKLDSLLFAGIQTTLDFKLIHKQLDVMNQKLKGRHSQENTPLPPLYAAR